MISLCLSLVVAALPPRVALMTASRVNVAEAPAAQLNARLATALKEAGLVVLEVNLPCQGDYACLQQQGQGVDVEAVVSVTLASGPRQIAIDVETVSVRTASSIDQRGFGWKNKQPLDSITTSIDECARAVAQKVLAARPVDVPKQVVLTPAPAAAAVVVIAPAVAVSRAPEAITGGAAVAMGIAAAVLAGVAFDQQSRLATEPPFTLTREQATARRDAANATYSAAAVSGGVAGALALTSLTLFLVR